MEIIIGLLQQAICSYTDGKVETGDQALAAAKMLRDKMNRASKPAKQKT